MGDQALVAALRCEDEGALREFFLRFRPALVLGARRLRVDPGELDATVDDCLADVAVHLITSDAAPPRSLPAYLARLKTIREQGYEISRDELIKGAVAMAVPYFGGNGQVQGSLAVFGPGVRVDEERVRAIVAALKEAGGQLSAALGYRARPDTSTG